LRPAAQEFGDLQIGIVDASDGDLLESWNVAVHCKNAHHGARSRSSAAGSCGGGLRVY
jgi:hypothetical protein